MRNIENGAVFLSSVMFYLKIDCPKLINKSDAYNSYISGLAKLKIDQVR
ncbi:MAG: hypothetical protein ACI823_001686 [Chitinophagales bacterium]|jgi:hypothetical protein